MPLRKIFLPVLLCVAAIAVVPSSAIARPCRGPLAKLNHPFPAHSLGQPAFRMSTRGVRLAAENARFTPREAVAIEQIVRGESARYPGVVSWDQGYGLTQLTPRVWSGWARSVLARLGGVRAALNPLKNLQMARWLYLHGGWGHWYGTQFFNPAGIASHVAPLLKRKWRCPVRMKRP